MQKIRRVAAIAATAGLLAFGAIAASGGVANATTGLITACSTSSRVTAVGFIPNCTSSGVITNPTSIVLTVNSPQLTALRNIVGDGIEDQWTLTCGEGGGRSFTRSGVLTVTFKQTSTSTDLPIGGSVPTSCTVTSEVQTILGLSTGLLKLGAVGVSDSVTGVTAIPGAVWTGNGDSVAKCADDTNNSGAIGNKVQIWTCLSDQADLWVFDSRDELMHRGLCLTDSRGKASLRTCTGAPGQEWTQRPTGGEVTLASDSGECLTDPSATNGTQLTVASCANTAQQRWKVPNAVAPLSRRPPNRYRYAAPTRGDGRAPARR
jgi:hypothetical protein